MPRTTPNLSKNNAPLPGTKPLLKTKVTQYVGFFTIGYILASAIFMMIQTQIALNPQLVTVLSIVVGAYIAVYKFIKHQHRVLNRSEMNRLTIGSTGAVWLLTTIYFLALWLFLFDAASREVLLEMTVEQPLPLLSALVMILVLTLVSIRVGLWTCNRLLTPK